MRTFKKMSRKVWFWSFLFALVLFCFYMGLFKTSGLFNFLQRPSDDTEDGQTLTNLATGFMG